MALTDLIHALSELEDAMDTCNRCGMCQAVCPLFRETGREGDVARGKIALLNGLRQDLLHDPGRVMDRLDRCLLCNACGRTCSRKLDLSTIFLKARLILTDYQGLPFYKKLIFRTLLRHPVLFDRVAVLLSDLQRWIPEGWKKNGSVVLARILPLFKNRSVPKLAIRSFRHMAKKTGVNPAALASPSRTVVFFTGCLIDKMLPEVGKACVQVLNRVGISVRYIDQEVCCGIPALASGDRLGFESLVKHNLVQMSGMESDAIVTACATCTTTLHDLWPRMIEYGHPLDGPVRRVSGQVMDILDYTLTRTPLTDLLSQSTSRETICKTRILTYHEPCHLRQGDLGKRIRTMLGSLPGYRYVETRDPGRCCGMGGSFGLAHADLSRQIGEKKARDIVDSGAEIVVTACPACMLQLKDMLARIGPRVEVRHMMEVLADVLGSE